MMYNIIGIAQKLSSFKDDKEVYLNYTLSGGFGLFSFGKAL